MLTITTKVQTTKDSTIETPCAFKGPYGNEVHIITDEKVISVYPSWGSVLITTSKQSTFESTVADAMRGKKIQLDDALVALRIAIDAQVSISKSLSSQNTPA